MLRDSFRLAGAASTDEAHTRATCAAVRDAPTIGFCVHVETVAEQLHYMHCHLLAHRHQSPLQSTAAVIHEEIVSH